MKPNSGLGFHCHHAEKLVEYVHDFNERVKYIKTYKPENERALRLRLFKLIPKNHWPKEGLKAFDEARKTYREAAKTYYEAWKNYDEAWKTYREAVKAYDEAENIYLKANKDAFKKLHKQLCPDCPWDGKTIFTRQDEDGNWY